MLTMYGLRIGLTPYDFLPIDENQSELGHVDNNVDQEATILGILQVRNRDGSS